MWIFMQIHTFMDILQQMKPKEQNVLSSKYYGDHCTLDTSYIFSYYVHSTGLCVFEFTINAQKSAV